MARVVGDRYRLDRELASGGMARVYLATDLRLAREVVVKMLRAELLDEPQHVERFRREAVALATIRSPHVVALHDLGHGIAEMYLVLRKIDGLTIAQLVRRGGAVPASRALHLIAQVLAGLTAIHAHGMVHRDLSPSNVIVDPIGHVVLVDLGVVQDRRHPCITPDAYTTGTPTCMSPEQTVDHLVDERSDLYQAARLCRLLLLGHDGEDLGGLPIALQATLARALSDVPGDRFATADELRTALARV
jgi:serine/threonine protein kinase